MRLLKIIYLFFFIAVIFFQNASAQSKRQTSFNADWKFHKGEVDDGSKSDLDDQSWRKLDLPHDWSIEGPFSDEWASGTGYLPAGIGWYRKSFALAPDQQAKNIYLYFDGVYKNSEVWINGQSVGKRPNGYVSFYYDITKHLNAKGKNVIAVRVDHSDFGDSRWYSGSGINRNVYLIAVDPIHVAVWGVTFTTPQVSSDKAEAKVTVSIKNNSAKTQNVSVKYELLDKQGKVIANATQQTQAMAGKDSESIAAFTISQPALWSVDNPNLYMLKISLLAGGKKIDEVTEQVGFRYFSFDANQGFSLNGKNIKLKGVCIHDDAGALGSAVPKDVWERRLKVFKEMGCNSIRMSHNPHQDYLYDLCDKLGITVQDETFDEWELGKNKWIKGWNVGTPGKDGYNKYFSEWADADLRDMILRNRNRASILMWSIGNEIDYPNDPYTHEILSTGRNPQIYGRGYQQGFPPASRLGELSKHLVQVAKRYDTTRPITAALAGIVMSNLTDFPAALDIVGYNYQEYRYKDDHEKYPQRIMYGSENNKSFNAWQSVDTLDYIAGQYLWTGIDFMGEARAWPARSSAAGLVDMAGFPKGQFYHRQSIWRNDPVIYIGTAQLLQEKESRQRELVRAEPNWNWTTGDSVRVNCFTNADEAELFLNGKSLGKKLLSKANQKTIFWDILFQPGELVAKGYKNSKEIKQFSLKTAGAPSALTAKIDRKALLADRDNVAHVEINIVDDKGIIVYGAENEIEISIDGPGRLIGLESGSITSHEDYKSNKRKAFHGKLLAYIQAEKPGAITVRIQTPGLKSQTVELQAK